MTTTKKDLPAIRSLKAIARRKMNRPYWQIEEPAEVTAANKAQTLAYNEALNKALKAQAKKIPVADLREIAYQNLLYLSPHHSGITRNSPSIAALYAAQDALKAKGISLPSSSYGKDQVAKAKKLFEELETAELQIIAGESVDLAKFTRQLQEL